MYYAIFDNFVDDKIIPNGFNMSLSEYERHRFKTSNKANVRFNNFLDNTIDYIPLHLTTYLADKSKFSNAPVIYPISINASSDMYPELRASGMNGFLSHISDKILDLVKKKEIKIILLAMNEPFFVEDIDQVFYSTSKEIGHDDGIEIWTPWSYPQRRLKTINRFLKCLKQVPYWERKTVEICKVTDTVYEKEKLYINLCRRYTPERLKSHGFLIKNNLIDFGYNSMPERNPATGATLPQEFDKIRASDKVTKKISASLNAYWKTHSPGITLDMKPIETFKTTYGSKGNHWGFPEPHDLEPFYKKTYISLIHEARYHQPASMITEKIYRAILYKHMFVIIGDSHILESLKMKGYKTFDMFWDESYDKITDNKQRNYVALNVFRNIITNEKTLKANYDRAKSILDHNYNTLLENAKSKTFKGHGE